MSAETPKVVDNPKIAQLTAALAQMSAERAKMQQTFQADRKKLKTELESEVDRLKTSLEQDRGSLFERFLAKFIGPCISQLTDTIAHNH